jgi:hypothetical protein
MKHAIYLSALSATIAFTACGGERGRITLTDAQPLSAPTAVGTAPMFAVAESGAEAAAWVSAPDRGTDGRLYISANGAPPVELRDSLGPIEAHGEAPPKIVYGRDGALNAIYVVGKVVPGRRFPLAALRFVRSTDNGRNWSAPVTVTDDSTFGSHNFHSLHAAPSGAIYVAWLDGREGKSAPYVSRSLDDGRSWSPNRRIAAGEACPCCRTALATANDGTLYAAWRAVQDSVRDIVLARSDDRGATFAAPRRVHADDWVFNGCPHAGPSLQVDDAGRVHIAWWTGKEGAAGVYYAHSDDGGATFSAPINMGPTPRPAHVQLAVGPNRAVIVVWDEATTTPQIRLRVSRAGGDKFGAAMLLSSPGTSATFPVVALSRKGFVVAWSQKSAAAAERDARSEPDMKNPHATMGLHAVGDAQVMVRRGSLN